MTLNVLRKKPQFITARGGSQPHLGRADKAVPGDRKSFRIPCVFLGILPDVYPRNLLRRRECAISVSRNATQQNEFLRIVPAIRARVASPWFGFNPQKGFLRRESIVILHSRDDRYRFVPNSSLPLAPLFFSLNSTIILIDVDPYDFLRSTNQPGHTHCRESDETRTLLFLSSFFYMS